MEMTGEQLVPASQGVTWAALNDPEVLKACIPGCVSIELVDENSYQVVMVAKVGPVSARFQGSLRLLDILPPESYALEFEGRGGGAGFGSGSAKVRLESRGEATQLVYEARATVGGKLAQIGSRLVDSAARKVAEDFFARFNTRVALQQAPGLASEEMAATPMAAAVQAPAAEAVPPPGSKRLPAGLWVGALVVAVAVVWAMY